MIYNTFTCEIFLKILGKRKIIIKVLQRRKGVFFGNVIIII